MLLPAIQTSGGNVDEATVKQLSVSLLPQLEARLHSMQNQVYANGLVAGRTPFTPANI